MRIVIGASHRGVSVRGMLVDLLRRRGDDVIDCGVFDSSPMDYSDIAVEVASKVSVGDAERGILIGGTAFEMSETPHAVKLSPTKNFGDWLCGFGDGGWIVLA